MEIKQLGRQNNRYKENTIIAKSIRIPTMYEMKIPANPITWCFFFVKPIAFIYIPKPIQISIQNNPSKI